MTTKTGLMALEGHPGNAGVEPAAESLDKFLDMWESINNDLDEYVFYRLVLPSGHSCDLRLSDLRTIRAGKKVVGKSVTKTPRKQNLTLEERERRGQRLRDYWSKKRGQPAGGGDA